MQVFSIRPVRSIMATRLKISSKNWVNKIFVNKNNSVRDARSGMQECETGKVGMIKKLSKTSKLEMWLIC